ncbi:hypothetical protein [Nonomuraea endophytica]|uniref:hypothetical protein n=1 Tax=Nonomuraea endophytica TaxID=714136 RepID=UPI0037CAFDD0
MSAVSHQDVRAAERVSDQLEALAWAHTREFARMSRIEFLDYFDLDISEARTLYGMYLRACPYARLRQYDEQRTPPLIQEHVIDSAVSTR